MSNKKSQVMSSVSEAISFIKERLEVDIKEAKIKKYIDVPDKDIQTICRILNSSVDASFFKVADSIEKKVKE